MNRCMTERMPRKKEGETERRKKEGETERRKKERSQAIPLQAYTDPEGCRRLGLPDFKTLGT